MNEVAWFLERPSPVNRYAAGLLSEAVGLRARFLDHPPSDDLPYVHHGHGDAPGRFALVIPHGETGQPTVAMPAVTDGPPWHADADIITGTVAFVTDTIHATAAPEHLDRHGRLRSSASYLAPRGGVIEPVVNRYAEGLASWLARIGPYEPLARWPKDARAAVALSHDVDRPDKYAILRAVRSGRLPPAGRLPWYAARAARDFAHRIRDRAPDDFWLFDEVVAAEAVHGFRSTFLFSVIPAYASYGSTNDVLYDASWSHLRGAMRRLRAEDIEVGLHASYHAYRDPARFRAERSRLEDLSDGPIRGLRHHFWQVGPDVEATLRAHEAAGFVYDSSLAFNDAVGLRRGIALPYRPWDSSAERPLTTWQIPVIALDSAAAGGVATAEEGVDRVWTGLERVFDAGGVAALDWHVRCSVPANERYRMWGQIYVGILERLAARPDVWVTGLGEVADWAERRRIELAPPTAES